MATSAEVMAAIKRKADARKAFQDMVANGEIVQLKALLTSMGV